jgi:hypothetical protein
MTALWPNTARAAVLVVFGALAVSTCTGCNAPARTQATVSSSLSARELLDRANEELIRTDVQRYAATLKEAASAQGSAEDHAMAAAALANYYWRIEKQYTTARKILSDTTSTECVARSLELARLEIAASDFSGSRKASRAAMACRGVTKQDLRRAYTLFAQAVEEEAFAQALAADVNAAHLDENVQEALALAAPYISNESGLRELSRATLLLALWAGNGKVALQSWDSYYRLLPGTNAPAPLTSASQVLTSNLPSFSIRSSDAERAAVVEALARSRFFSEAAALSIHWQLPQSEQMKAVVEYGHWMRTIGPELDEQYRLRAIGKGDSKTAQREFEVRCQELWRALNADGKREFKLSDFLEELGARFGAVIRPLPQNISFGHIIEERTQTVEQYGRKAQLRVFVLDSMVSNGYTSWLWDGRAAIGGWDIAAAHEAPPTIIQIRGDQAVSAWESVTDADEIRRNRESLARWAADDDVRALQNPYAYLPGLRLRMILAGRQRLLDHLVSSGKQGPELRVFYMREFSRLTDEATIFAHEGRHVLDRLDKPYLSLVFNASENLEYRAKLSEVTFAPEPLLAIGGIFYSNIGQKGDPHGMANERIMKGLVNWMKAHSSEIQALDSSRPLLPQFDLLTDEQMREAFRSMDPWASSRSRP